MKSWESGNLVVGLFLDLSKAFDTVNLINELFKYGIRGIVLDWFISYLTNGRQFVLSNNIKSSIKNINCGMPQGSILGPWLFLIYVNDIATVPPKLFFLIFADDTNVFNDGKDIVTC